MTSEKPPTTWCSSPSSCTTSAPSRTASSPAASGALCPGGVFVIFDAFRPQSAADARQLGALMEFYFALTSRSGTWSPREMASWQREAGREPRDPIHLRTAPGAGLQAAAKPR